MMKRTATVHREVVGYLRFLCIFARKDIRNANANRMNLFSRAKSGQFSYISKFHILISYKLTIYIVMCFYQGTN